MVFFHFVQAYKGRRGECEGISMPLQLSLLKEGRWSYYVLFPSENKYNNNYILIIDGCYSNFGNKNTPIGMCLSF